MRPAMSWISWGKSPSSPYQTFRIWRRSSRLPGWPWTPGSRVTVAAKTGARSSDSEGISTLPMGTPLRYPSATPSFRSQRSSGRSQPPKKRGVIRGPLVAKVSRRRMTSKSESRAASATSVGVEGAEPDRLAPCKSIGIVRRRARIPGPRVEGVARVHVEIAEEGLAQGLVVCAGLAGCDLPRAGGPTSRRPIVAVGLHGESGTRRDHDDREAR
jgi:hypothetical protein